MGGGGVSPWFTAVERKRATCTREERAPQGGHIQWLALWESRNCSGASRNKASIGALGALRWRKLRDNCIVP